MYIFCLKNQYFVLNWCGMVNEKLKTEFEKIYQECRQNHIPVVRDQTAKLLCEMIAKKTPAKILEIGTAVGYSGTLMLLSCEKSNLTTVELNAEMCKKAEQTFKKYGVEQRVQIVNQDALTFLQKNNELYDFIFVDGPKGQYIKYLPHLKRAIKTGGIIFCDDVLYFGMVKDDRLVIHKKITIVRNLREFIATIQSDPDLKSELLEIEDGIMIVEKVK